MSQALAVGASQVILFALQYCPETVVELYYEASQERELKPFQNLGLNFQKVQRDRLDQMVAASKGKGHSTEQRHSGIVAKLRVPVGQSLEELSADTLESRGALVALDGIEDVHNLGAIARSALLLGAKGLVMTQNRGARLGVGALKASSGTLMLGQFSVVTNLSQALRDLKKSGFWIAGLSAEVSTKELIAVEKLSEYLPLVIVVGSEHKGLRPSTADKCDFLTTLPLAEPYQEVSLNASVAASVALAQLGLTSH